MTSISYLTYHDTYIFECSGHTGYADAGKDILCSAVSTLCYTLDAYLQNARERGDIARYISDFSDGNVRIEFECADICREREEAILEAADAILGGFRLLWESFPDHISIDF